MSDTARNGGDGGARDSGGGVPDRDGRVPGGETGAVGSRDADSGPASAADQVRLTAWVRGRVQGVGFRWWTRATALEIGGLSGYVSNLADGRVQVVAEGARERCERLLGWLTHGDTPGRVDGVTEIWGVPRGGYDGFTTR